MAIETNTEVELSGAELKEIANPIIKLIGELQKGHNTHAVVLAALAAVGSCVRQSHMVLPLDAPLRDALPSLVWGYENAAARMQDS
jgi:hypothetical protein